MDLDVHLPAIAAGDPDAFSRWVAGSEFRLRASLQRFATRVDVEAVLQETLLRVWQTAPRFEPDGQPEALLRFAVRVARNVAISEIRRAGKRVDPDERPPAVAPPIEPDPMLRQVIAGCREELPDKPRQALAARLAGAADSDRAMAAQLGMQPNTFLQNVTRARKLLMACLERHGVLLEAVMR